MRVIVVSDYGQVNGGASKVAISSLAALANAGVEVTFISGVDGGIFPYPGTSIKSINFQQYDLLGNPSRIRAAIDGIWNFECAQKFENVLKDYDPKDTIIHFHSWCQALSSSVIAVAKRKQFKVVLSLHDYFSVCPNGGLYNYKSQIHCKLEPMSLSCFMSNCDARNYRHKLWRFGRQMVQTKFGGIPKLVDSFIVVSQYSEVLLKKNLSGEKNFFLIPNPINVDKSDPAAPADNSNFIYVGRVSHEKGANLMALASSLADIPISFIGTGPGVPDVLRLNPSADMLGWKDGAEVLKGVQSSRALVFPSLLHETQGLVVQEAFALGIPVIVSSNCAASGSVKDGVNGMIFNSGDHSDLARCLTFMKNNDDSVRQFGRAAYDSYWNNPSTMQNYVANLIKCYSETLSK